MSRHNPDVYPDHFPTEEIPTVNPHTKPRWSYILLAVSALALLVESVAPLWLPEPWVFPVVETVAAIAAVVGLIEGGLAVQKARHRHE